MNFEQFTKALTNEYLMVVNNDQAEVLGSGNIENILDGSNFAKNLLKLQSYKWKNLAMKKLLNGTWKTQLRPFM